MAQRREYQFDAYRKLAGMRLTPDEQRAMFYALMNVVEPKTEEDTRGLQSVGEYVEAAQAYEQNWGKMQGLSCGYRSIDALTHGYAAGELVILGGYTSRGKTQLAVNMAYRIARAGTPVLFVTLEMTKAMLTSRFMRLGGIGANTPIFFQGAEAVEPGDLDGLIMQAKADGCGFVVVDHLHYFARGDNVLGKVGEVTRDFKRLAVKHELPVMLLSQLSRPEKISRNTRLKVPSLSDLKESSYIEQDADIVLMVHRNFPEDDDLEVNPNEVVVAQRKNRNRGMTGKQTIFLRHDADNGVLLSEVLIGPFPQRKL